MKRTNDMQIITYVSQDISNKIHKGADYLGVSVSNLLRDFLERDFERYERNLKKRMKRRNGTKKG